MYSIQPSKHVQIVSSFDELVSTKLTGDINALCWQRSLTGDFKEIADKLELTNNITEVTVQDLESLTLTAEGVLARAIIIEDLKLLAANGNLPNLNLLKKYERDTEFDFISTDVYSFHVDRAPICSDTYLCTYFGAASDIVANEDVVQKIQVPEVRQQLRKLFDGPEAEFEDFLKEYFFDLHYQLKPNAKPINLGIGHLWRLAVDAPQQEVLPCVHRAPVENKDEYRLMLIC